MVGSGSNCFAFVVKLLAKAGCYCEDWTGGLLVLLVNLFSITAELCV